MSNKAHEQKPAHEHEEGCECDEEECGDEVNAKEIAAEHLKELPEQVQRRVHALRAVQKQATALELAFRDELDALERKYHGLNQPLQARRAEIVCGAAEPTAEELEGYAASAEAKSAPEARGVPDFWYHALVNNPSVRELTGLNDRDKEALAALRDIRVGLLPRTRETVEGEAVVKHGYTLTFVFAENEFFEERELVKTYKLIESEDGETTLDSCESTKLTWKAGKNLTVRSIKKAVGGSGKRGGRKAGAGGATQFKTVEEPCESFFHFFQSIKVPEKPEEMDPDEYQELNEAVQGDFEVGSEIKDNVCNRALLWYTGDAVEEDEGEEDWDEDDLDEDEDDEDDDEEDDDDDEEAEEKPRKGAAKPKAGDKPAGAENPECKQQ